MMNFLGSLLHFVEQHHDFLLVVAAMLAASLGPIAAIWIGSRQIHASRMTEYRATVLQKLRDDSRLSFFTCRSSLCGGKHPAMTWRPETSSFKRVQEKFESDFSSAPRRLNLTVFSHMRKP
jgi:hypothetical protein